MAMLIIKGATIFTPDPVIENGVVWVQNGRIQAIDTAEKVPLSAQAQIIDAHNHLLVPGFIDLQLNGGFGQDFTHDPAGIWAVAGQLPRYGVTAFLPTIITSPLHTIQEAQAILSQGPPKPFAGAMPLGLHLEGPFLNPDKKGAHNPAHLRPPAAADIADWSRAAGIWLVTLAPELPGALDMITALSTNGIVVSAGHSLATYEEGRAAIAAGIQYGTHLFNTMPDLHHRRPGLVTALLEDERVTIGLIADGIHVHPSLVKLVWRLIGSGRLNLVTDAIAALGMASGSYRLGDFQVMVDPNSARLADGRLAGSILSLDAALHNLMAFSGRSLAQVLPTVTTTPATLLKISHQKGQIAPGFDADLVLLNPDLTVAGTIVAGEIVYWQS